MAKGNCLLEDKCEICTEESIFRNLLKNQAELLVRLEGDLMPFKVENLSLTPYNFKSGRAFRLNGNIVVDKEDYFEGDFNFDGIVNNKEIILGIFLGKNKFITRSAKYFPADNCIRFSYQANGTLYEGSITSLH